MNPAKLLKRTERDKTRASRQYGVYDQILRQHGIKVTAPPPSSKQRSILLLEPVTKEQFHSDMENMLKRRQSDE
jgi:hypothetical protein